MDQLPSFFKKDGIFESLIRRTIGFNRERLQSDLLFARTLDTSADLISLTKIGLGRWEEESNFPKQNESLIDPDWTEGVMLERTDTAFSRSDCRRSDLEVPFLHSSTPNKTNCTFYQGATMTHVVGAMTWKVAQSLD